MKVLLINPPVFLKGRQLLEYGQEPYTLLCLAAVLKRDNYNVDIIDFLVERYNAGRLQRMVQDVDVVGISVSSRTLNSAVRVARDIKEMGNPFVIAGGPHATISPYDLLKDKYIDVVVRGEGEETLLEILRKLDSDRRDLKDISGIAFCEGVDISLTRGRQFIKDLDSLPWPDRKIIDYSCYKKRFWGLRTFSVMAGRGCPYRCIFCSQVNGRVARWRSPDNVISEIKNIIMQFGIKAFIFMDDTFTMNRKWLERFLDILEKEKLSIYYKINGRINNMTYDLLRRMKETGLRAITFGVESGDEEILKKIGKEINLEEVKRVCRWAESVELEVICNFMVGFPFEDSSSIDKTIEFAGSLPISFLNQSLVTPFPGTELFDYLSREEKESFDYERLNTFVDPFKARSVEDFNETMIMNNRNMRREEIINKFIILRLNFFKNRMSAEIREIGKRMWRFLGYLFREPFLIALALSFPATRSFIVAIFFRIFRSGKGRCRDIAFFLKVMRFMLDSKPYLKGRKKFL